MGKLITLLKTCLSVPPTSPHPSPLEAIILYTVNLRGTSKEAISPVLPPCCMTVMIGLTIVIMALHVGVDL